VLVEGLSQYQGPALLAYNDASFSEKDFRSLTSLGDSKKVHDKAATGKFGLGFSSVSSNGVGLYVALPIDIDRY